MKTKNGIFIIFLRILIISLLLYKISDIIFVKLCVTNFFCQKIYHCY